MRRIVGVISISSFLFLLSLLGIQILSIPALTVHSLNADVHQKISKLKDHGKFSLQNHQFQQAIRYYSAITFLVEGMKGQAAAEIRRRCGLSLAECELKIRRYSHCIARCSEVIEEAVADLQERSRGNLKTVRDDLKNHHSSAPKKKKRNKSLFRSLALAYYRRAICLKALNHFELALLDLRSALEYQPDDNNILEEIVDTHFSQGDNRLLLNKKEKSSQTSTEQSATEANSNEGEKEEEEELVNSLYDFTEQCQLNHPRISMNDRLVQQLCEEDPVQLLKQKELQRNQKKLPEFPSFLAPGASSAFSALQGMGNDLSGLRGMLRMFGFDASTSERILDVLSAILKIAKGIKRSIQFVEQNKIPLILVGSTLLIALLLWKNY